MKGIKKLLTGILAATLALTMNVTAFAATNSEVTVGSGQASITVDNAAEGQEYKLYKIFDYEPSEAGATKGVYRVRDEWKTVVTSDDAKKYVEVDVNGYVKWIHSDENSSTTGKDHAIAEFAKLLQAAVDGKTVLGTATADVSTDNVADAKDKTVKFNGLDYGYYMVYSSLGALVSLDTTTPEATLKEKNDQPTISKEVKEDSTSKFGDKNDAQIGQVVEYKTTVNAKAGGKNYVVYDKMDAGLTFAKDRGVTVTGLTGDNFTKDSSANADYTLDATATNDYTFKLTINGTFKADATITVTYYATINEAAVVGTALVNDTYLEYNNHAKTEHDSTETFIYKFNLFKKDDSDHALAGAKFSLKNSIHEENIAFVLETAGDTYVYRVANATEAARAVAIDGSATKDADGNVVMPGLTVGNAYKEVITPASGKVEVRGLDADEYVLHETEAPSGYNLLDEDITFQVNRETTFGSYRISAGDEIKVDTNEIHVINKSGTLLPSTGGIGTTIFYIVGGLLIIAGVAYFIVRRKANAQ